MPVVTIRNLPEEIYRALKARAIQHHRSTEAEILAILEEAVRPNDRIKLGSLLADLGGEVGFIELEINQVKIEIEPANFE